MTPHAGSGLALDHVCYAYRCVPHTGSGLALDHVCYTYTDLLTDSVASCRGSDCEWYDARDTKPASVHILPFHASRLVYDIAGQCSHSTLPCQSSGLPYCRQVFTLYTSMPVVWFTLLPASVHILPFHASRLVYPIAGKCSHCTLPCQLSGLPYCRPVFTFYPSMPVVWFTLLPASVHIVHFHASCLVYPIAGQCPHSTLPCQSSGLRYCRPVFTFYPSMLVVMSVLSAANIHIVTYY